jgi:hypothetical protein
MPDERTSIDIKSFIKEVADNAGFDSSKALDIAERLVKEKCYDVEYSPYGGATSFSEIESNMAGMEYQAKFSQTTYELEGIIGNITRAPGIDIEEKARKMADAINDYKERVTNIRADQGSSKSLWGKVKEMLNLDAGPRGPQANGVRDLPVAGGFKVYTDSAGEKRWLSLSSNAFEDLDKELFTTDALQEAIDFADKNDERGPLLVYHVPSAEIGQCDYQAMAGRFLVESGTFLDTPLGHKALEYFENTKEDHQVSIGFQYRVGDELDGQFDWLRIKERSSLPFGAAANPWTDFKLITGDATVNEQKAAHLRAMFGDELAGQVIANAESKTKELELSGTRYKETQVQEYDEKELGEITDVEEIKEVAEPLAHVHGNVKHTHRVVPESAHIHQGLPAFKAVKKPAEDAADGGADDSEEDANGKKKPPFMKKETELAELLATLVEDVGTIRETVNALDSEFKALKQESESAKERENNRPRYTPIGGRPTDNEGNIIGSKELEDVLNASQDGANPLEKNPAFAYVQDFLGGVRA